MAKAFIGRYSKKDLRHAKSRRESLLKKIRDPHDKDDPDWVKKALDNIEKRIVRKKKAITHRQSQLKIGARRRVKRSEP